MVLSAMPSRETPSQQVHVATEVASDSDCNEFDSSSDSDARQEAGGAEGSARTSGGALVVASAVVAHTSRALRRSERTVVGVGCKYAWVLEQSRYSLTWMLSQTA